MVEKSDPFALEDRMSSSCSPFHNSKKEDVKVHKRDYLRRAKSGFTLLEVLIVVGITAILAGVAFINVPIYLRSTTKLEYDGYAESIFVAAQNHLSLAAHENYLGRTGFGVAEKEKVTGSDGTETEEETGIYYLTVTSPNDFDDDDSILNLLLPDGAIDETVRQGNYLIRYYKDAGRVVNVFYWRDDGRFPYGGSSLTGEDGTSSTALYDKLINQLKTTGGTEKNILSRFGADQNAVIGFYGSDTTGDVVDPLPNFSNTKLTPPGLVVSNGDVLKVEITDMNPQLTQDNKVSNVLVIKGENSGKSIEIDLDRAATDSSYKYHYLYTDGILQRKNDSDPWTLVLDDVTKPGMRFKDILGTSEIGFIPGEDLYFYAYAQEKADPTNYVYSETDETNSLFGDGTTSGGKNNEDGSEGTAVITSIRHLQNLDQATSQLDGNDTDVPGNDSASGKNSLVNITKAEQSGDISWEDFKNGTSYTGNFDPIQPPKNFTYDGNGHKISDVVIQKEGDAGLFSSPEGLTVDDLVLEDFDVTSTNGGNAGALAGTLTDGEIHGVIVKNGEDDPATPGATPTPIPNITSNGGNAGGVIGEMIGGTITGSGAAVPVEATPTESGSGGNAGGLIGKATPKSTTTTTTDPETGTETTTTTTTYPEINGCFSGGHTKDGDYEAWIKEKPQGSDSIRGYDIKGGTSAGGLVGDAGGSTIKNSYSTCSVQTSKTDGVAGGLVGSAGVNTDPSDTQNGSITNCYATGLVSGPIDANGKSTGGGSIGSFAGTMTPGAIGRADDNTFYGLVNEENDVPAVGIGPDIAILTDDQKKDKQEAVNSSISDKIENFTSSLDDYDAMIQSPEERGSAEPYDNPLIGYYQGGYNLPTAAQLRENEKSQLKTKLSSIFSTSTEDSTEIATAKNTIASLGSRDTLTKEEKAQLESAERLVAEDALEKQKEYIASLPDTALTSDDLQKLEDLKDLVSIYKTNTHVGDWPSPETLFINEKQ